jgi:hypothetical protein
LLATPAIVVLWLDNVNLLAGQVPPRSVRMVGFERMSQSFQFQAQAKERKQRATEQKPVAHHQKYIGIAIERREMPEENHREQCPTEDEAEAIKKQQHVTLNLTGTLKWDWNASQTSQYATCITDRIPIDVKSS